MIPRFIRWAIATGWIESTCALPFEARVAAVSWPLTASGPCYAWRSGAPSIDPRPRAHFERGQPRKLADFQIRGAGARRAKLFHAARPRQSAWLACALCTAIASSTSSAPRMARSTRHRIPTAIACHQVLTSSRGDAGALHLFQPRGSVANDVGTGRSRCSARHDETASLFDHAAARGETVRARWERSRKRLSPGEWP